MSGRPAILPTIVRKPDIAEDAPPGALELELELKEQEQRQEHGEKEKTVVATEAGFGAGAGVRATSAEPGSARPGPRRSPEIHIEALDIMTTSATKEDVEAFVTTHSPELIRCYAKTISKPRRLKLWFISGQGRDSVHASPDGQDALRLQACVRHLGLPLPDNRGASYDTFALLFEPKRRVL